MIWTAQSYGAHHITELVIVKGKVIQLHVGYKRDVMQNGSLVEVENCNELFRMVYTYSACIVSHSFPS